MRNKYPIIAKILENEFSYEMEINRDEGVTYLINGISEGRYDIQMLKKEYDLAIVDSTYDWVEFATKTKMLWDSESYSKKDVINYLKYYLHEVVYIEDIISTEKSKLVLDTALKILINLQDNDGWIELNKLYEKIVSSTNLVYLPFYAMYQLLIIAENKIEGKPERGKRKEKILIKHKQYSPRKQGKFGRLK